MTVVKVVLTLVDMGVEAVVVPALQELTVLALPATIMEVLEALELLIP
tara:strand:+ start:337 stop:480 length:144 start_codon:yes stop_codon:yes gene_type:complete